MTVTPQITVNFFDQPCYVRNALRTCVHAPRLEQQPGLLDRHRQLRRLFVAFPLVFLDQHLALDSATSAAQTTSNPVGTRNIRRDAGWLPLVDLDRAAIHPFGITLLTTQVTRDICSTCDRRLTVHVRGNLSVSWSDLRICYTFVR